MSKSQQMDILLNSHGLIMDALKSVLMLYLFFTATLKNFFFFLNYIFLRLKSYLISSLFF